MTVSRYLVRTQEQSRIATRDYQAGQARSSFPSVSRARRAIALPCVLDAGAAKALADTLLSRAWALRDRLTLRLSPDYLDLVPGDLVRPEGVAGDWIVDTVEIEQMVVTASLRPAWRSAGTRVADPGGRWCSPTWWRCRRGWHCST